MEGVLDLSVDQLNADRHLANKLSGPNASAFYPTMIFSNGEYFPVLRSSSEEIILEKSPYTSSEDAETASQNFLTFARQLDQMSPNP